MVLVQRFEESIDVLQTGDIGRQAHFRLAERPARQVRGMLTRP